MFAREGKRTLKLINSTLNSHNGKRMGTKLIPARQGNGVRCEPISRAATIRNLLLFFVVSQAILPHYLQPFLHLGYRALVPSTFTMQSVHWKGAPGPVIDLVSGKTDMANFFTFLFNFWIKQGNLYECTIIFIRLCKKKFSKEGLATFILKEV